MWNYIANKTTILVVLICILTVFIIIQWYETKKLRHKISKIDKQIHSLGKNQLYLEQLITKSLTYPSFTPQSKTQSVPLAQQVRPSKPPLQPQSKPQSQPSRVLPTPSKIIVISETQSEEKLPAQESKIIEIDDEESENSSDDEDVEEEFNEKTLDLELENELNELK